METLYIDVYFLINFLVDILSSHFSARFLHIKTSVPRLILIGVLGAASAILDVLFSRSLALKLPNTVLFLTLAGFLISKRCSTVRRLKFIVGFLVFCLTLAGIVYFSYTLLDGLFKDYPTGEVVEVENRGALVFSLIVLCAIGVFKILTMIFSGARGMKNVRIRIEIDGTFAETDALVDSGNLVKDPMNMYPVLFLKQGFAKTFLPKEILELSSLNNLEKRFKKRVRLIPVTKSGETHVLTGIRVDKVSVLSDGRVNEVEVSIAIDKEDGTFGGFEALLPSCVVDDVL